MTVLKPRYTAEISGDMRFGPFRWHIVITEQPHNRLMGHEVARGTAWTRSGAERRAQRMLRRAIRISAHQRQR